MIWATALFGKSIDFGICLGFFLILQNCNFRYKAEVDVDGRELARYYLSQRDIKSIMKEIKNIQSDEDLELFMLKHGENIVDCLGEQVDRIEKELKNQHPELRHVDLEVL